MSDTPKRPAAPAGSTAERRVIAQRNTAYGPALPVAGLVALAELATRAARRDPDTTAAGDPAATPRQTATTHTAATNRPPVATHDAVATAERSGHEGARR